MNTTKLHTAIRFTLSAVFCVVLVACASEVEPTSGPTLSPTSGDPTATFTNAPTNTPSLTPTPLPIENQIAFFVSKGTNASIARMNPDGSGLTHIVDLEIGLGEYSTTYQSDISLHNVNTDTFSWSPDGAWIVYASSEDGDSDLYAIDVEGTTKIKLTDTPDDEWLPSWSPDGRYIAYGVKTPDTAYILDLETMETKQIFEIMELSQGWLDQFTWSPDSNILTYTALSGNGYVIWDIFGHIASDDFKSIGRFVPHLGRTIGALNWSPSGDSFVYSGEVKAFGDIGLFITASRSRSEQRLLTVSPKGTNQSKLFNIDWSPDGTTLVYSITNENRTSDIYRIDPDGENLTRLTENTYSPCECSGYLSPVWSPDGSKIAYLSVDSVKHDIFIMNPDGSEQTRLTNDPKNQELDRWYPQWQPVRKSMNIPLSKDDGIPNPKPKSTDIPWPTPEPTSTPRPTLPTPTEIVVGKAIEDIMINLQENNYKCRLWFDESTEIYTATCSRSEGTLNYSVEISSKSTDRYDNIEAYVIDMAEPPGEYSHQEFFVYVSGLPFHDQPSIQDELKRELDEYDLNKGSEYVFHGFIIKTNPGKRGLTIYIEPSEE